MKKQSENRPKDYEILRVGGKPQLTVNFLIEERHEEEKDYWEYHSVKLPVADFEYGSIVSAMINDVYSNDQMQAIVNNYLLGDHTHDAEFNEMQEYRKYAKNTAKEIIEKITSKTEE